MLEIFKFSNICIEFVERYQIYFINFLVNIMRRFEEIFQSLTINFKSVTVIVLDGDRAMSLRVDNSEWSFPFAMQLTFTEELDLGVE